MSKLSTETVRFLNHLEREKQSAVQPLKSKIRALQLDCEELKRSERFASAENCVLLERVRTLESQLETTEIKTDMFLDRIRKLLGKLRIDIYSGKTSTPRWFKTGKWWSRERGGFDHDEINDLTQDELIEAFEFYCDTDLPFLLRSSMRDELQSFEAAKCLWYRYEALSEQEKYVMTFPQFCGCARADYKSKLKNEIEQSEI